MAVSCKLSTVVGNLLSYSCTLLALKAQLSQSGILLKVQAVLACSQSLLLGFYWGNALPASEE